MLEKKENPKVKDEEKDGFFSKLLALVFPRYWLASYDHRFDADHLPTKDKFAREAFFAVLLFVVAMPMKLVALVTWRLGDEAPFTKLPFGNGFLWLEVFLSLFLYFIGFLLIVAII